MKLVVAIIQPFKLDEVRRRLQRLPAFTGMSVTRGNGFGREKSEVESHSVRDELSDFTDNVRIETLVPDQEVEEVLNAIASAAHTGRYGDGVVFSMPVEHGMRIKTLERIADEG